MYIEKSEPFETPNYRVPTIQQLRQKRYPSVKIAKFEGNNVLCYDLIAIKPNSKGRACQQKIQFPMQFLQKDVNIYICHLPSFFPWF